MSLVRSIMTISSHTIISRILGLVRDLLIVHSIGANAITDALQTAIKIPSLFRRLFAEGAFNSAFVPMFAGILTTAGRQSAKVFAEHAMTFLMLFLIMMTGIIEFFMPEFVNLIAPGFAKTPERLYYTIEFTRITFPFIIFICMSAILGGVLNSLDRFAAPASAQSIGNLFIIGVLYFFSNIGPNPGYAASWGVLLSGVSQFIWLYVFCGLAGIPMRFRLPKSTPEVKEFFKKLLPGMLGAGVVQINLLFDVLLGSYLPEASISYLSYADRINQFPLSVIGVSMGVALLPLLTKQLKQGEIENALSTQNRAMEFVLLLTIPAATALILCSHFFVDLLYGHGKFIEFPENVTQTAYTLSAFCVGLPAYVLVKVFSSSFFARQDTVTPVIIGIISVITNILINLCLMQYYQHVGIAIGTAIASWINAFLLAKMLRKRKMMILDKYIFWYTAKVITSAIIMGCIIYAIQLYFLPDISIDSFFQKAEIVTVLVTIGGISFLIPAHYLHCINLKNVRKILKHT